MLDLTVIILTFNESRHIRRCLDNVMPIAKRVYVVDCNSTDGTQEIASTMGANVVEHPWPGNQAEQFNWALDNLDIETEWVLRLDADEYLTPELIDELHKRLPNMPADISAISLPRGRTFAGRRLKHGIVNGVKIIRIFRPQAVRYEHRVMDEHLSVLHGNTIELKHQFIDDNLMPIGQFIIKHDNYASREAAMLLADEYGINTTLTDAGGYSDSVTRKRAQKDRYARLPLFWRAFGYFVYRYVFKLGFLDGREGFLWDFMQGWWYRTLVDAKVMEARSYCGNDPDKIRRYITEVLGVKL